MRNDPPPRWDESDFRLEAEDYPDHPRPPVELDVQRRRVLVKGSKTGNCYHGRALRAFGPGQAYCRLCEWEYPRLEHDLSMFRKAWIEQGS